MGVIGGRVTPMTLINDIVSGVGSGVTWGLDHTGGRPGFVAAAAGLSLATVGAWWWRTNPHFGQDPAPRGPVDATAPTATALLASQMDAVRPLPPLALTSSAIVASNVGDDGVTAYDAVGPAAIAAAVRQFYALVLADPDLAPYFTNVDMERLRRHQALFIGQLWGGPVHFELERLVSAHRHLRITGAHYWRVVGHLLNVLTDLEVPAWVVLFTMGALYDVHRMVINEDDETVITDDDSVIAKDDGLQTVRCPLCVATSQDLPAHMADYHPDHTPTEIPVERDAVPPIGEHPDGWGTTDTGRHSAGHTRTSTVGGPGFNSPTADPSGTAGSC